MHIPGKYRFLLLLAVWLLSAGSNVRAQEWESFVNYNHVGLNDTITLEYVFTGTGKTLGASVDVHDFHILNGPLQFNNSSITQMNGSVIEKKSTSLTYYLLMDSVGDFIIPPATLWMADSSYHRTASLQIRVSEPPFKKRDVQHKDIFAANLPLDSFVKETRLLDELHPRIGNAIYIYLVVAGWTYKEQLTSHRSQQLLDEAEQYVTGRRGIQRIGVYDKKETPRLYYSVADTSGIRTTLNRIFAKGGKEAKSRITIKDPREWNPNDDYAFDDDFSLWWQIYDILGQLQRVRSFMPQTKREVEMLCYFEEEQQMDRFIAFAKENGYTEGESKRTTKTKLDRYSVKLSKFAEMKDSSIFSVVRFLQDAGKKRTYNATIWGPYIKAQH